MSKKIKIVYIGRNICKYTTKITKERISFIKDIPKETDEQDAEYLLKLRGKGCRCHNKEGRFLFLTYAEWKEYRDLKI